MQTISESVHTISYHAPVTKCLPCSDGRRAVSAAPAGFAAVAAWQANVCAPWQQEGRGGLPWLPVPILCSLALPCMNVH